MSAHRSSAENKNALFYIYRRQWNGNERKELLNSARLQQKKKATLKCETKWGVFACNMGLGLFKRDQIIYNCVIIIIIIELRAHTNKRPLNDLKSIRENSFQFSDKCCSNQSRPTESDRFEWRIDDTENK